MFNHFLLIGHLMFLVICLLSTDETKKETNETASKNRLTLIGQINSPEERAWRWRLLRSQRRGIECILWSWVKLERWRKDSAAWRGKDKELSQGDPGKHSLVDIKLKNIILFMYVIYFYCSLFIILYPTLDHFSHYYR